MVFLLRLSLHEPLLVLQIENDQPGHLPAIVREISERLLPFEAIDQSAIKQFLEK